MSMPQCGYINKFLGSRLWYIYLTIYLPIYLSACLSVYLTICLSTYLNTHILFYHHLYSVFAQICCWLHACYLPEVQAEVTQCPLPSGWSSKTEAEQVFSIFQIWTFWVFHNKSIHGHTKSKLSCVYGSPFERKNCSSRLPLAWSSAGLFKSGCKLISESFAAVFSGPPLALHMRLGRKLGPKPLLWNSLTSKVLSAARSGSRSASLPTRMLPTWQKVFPVVRSAAHGFTSVGYFNNYFTLTRI